MNYVRVVGWDELPEEMRDTVPDNGSGKEYATYVIAHYKGETTVFSDAVEPEDATYSRDFSGIVQLLDKVIKNSNE